LSQRDARLIGSPKAAGMVWPLNVFVTPDGHPLYATLYHPPEEFHKILVRIEQLWRNDRARLTTLARIEAVAPQGPGKPEVSGAQARALADRVVAERSGGRRVGWFRRAGKFAISGSPSCWRFYERKPSPRLKNFCSLDAMASTAQDHLGGSFPLPWINCGRRRTSKRFV
jgi:uncharacterized protein YyaL (SSP411 family)